MKCVFTFEADQAPTKIKDPKKSIFDNVLKTPGNWPPGFLSKIFNLGRGERFKSSHPWPEVWLLQTELDFFFPRRKEMSISLKRTHS
jgi:hypothetical protein